MSLAVRPFGKIGGRRKQRAGRKERLYCAQCKEKPGIYLEPRVAAAESCRQLRALSPPVISRISNQELLKFDDFTLLSVFRQLWRRPRIPSNSPPTDAGHLDLQPAGDLNVLWQFLETFSQNSKAATPLRKSSVTDSQWVRFKLRVRFL